MKLSTDGNAQRKEDRPLTEWLRHYQVLVVGVLLVVVVAWGLWLFKPHTEPGCPQGSYQSKQMCIPYP